MKEYKFPSKGHLGDVTIKAINGALVGTEGKWICLTVGMAKKPRSNRQNRYWFGVINKYIYPQVKSLGYNWSAYDIHQIIMQELGYEKIAVTPSGKITVVLDRSSKFCTKEWEDFMEAARALLSQKWGVLIPLPNEDGDLQ
jgi:hypothetical protein